MKVPVYRSLRSPACGRSTDLRLWSAVIGPGTAKSPIHLHYRNDMGVEQAAPILAARNVETSDGHVLLLWVYLDHDKVEYEFDKGDDESDEDNFE